MPPVLSVYPYGDAAVCAHVSAATPPRAWEVVHALAGYLERTGPPAILNTVPTYDTVFVEFDCAAADRHQVRQAIEVAFDALLCTEHRAGPEPRRFRVPVVYGGEHGPDLEFVASHLGLRPDELAAAHAGHVHSIRCLAGPVGGPMMAGPPLPSDVPRQRSPRTDVPAGAVLLAGRQAFLKTMRGPGGWQIVGRTPLSLIDLDADPLVPWRPGDEIRFVPIDPEQWPAWEGRRPAHDDG
ncbi:5-oxoprolinase subunit B family protein [Pseudonocardia acaciae]|uniref:5-oxoprolinase subunit B family protein n=1 Tax=Pseudonocardia acaciae TaxID=551276 RepID=UPI00048E7C7E|nr:carboxyltransferase domain-containing protein [Pseudonocardia acaciae]